MKYIYLLILILIIDKCSVGGPGVVDVKEFKSGINLIINAKIQSCKHDRTTNRNEELELALNNLLLNPKSAIFEIGLLKVHVSEKDAEFCYTSLRTAPCGRLLTETQQNLLANRELYCKPKLACFFDRQNFGKGSWCVRETIQF
jgi:hypothetical protein